MALFLSRIDPKKGLDLLLRALAAAKARGMPLALVIAGTGEPAYEAALRREAHALGVDGDVVWAGFVDGREKLAVLADADLFVLPSRSENFAVSVVEAMACGAAGRGLRSGRDPPGGGGEPGPGVVVPCRGGRAGGALGAAGADPAARREHGARGRRLARERFSVETMTARLLDLYASLRAVTTVHAVAAAQAG